MAITFDLPGIADEVVGRDGRMSDPWYRFFELFVRVVNGTAGDLSTAVSTLEDLNSAIEHAQALILNLQGSVEDVINVPISSGDGLTGGGSIADGLTGGTISFSLDGSDVGPAVEAILVDDALNVVVVGGVWKVQKADADAGKPCHGFAKAAFGVGETVKVFTFGVAGSGGAVLTPGYVYLSNTPGEVTSTVPSSGTAQRVGVALSASTYAFLWQDPFDI